MHDRKFNEILKEIQRRISALGARWGLMSEEAFRNGLRPLLEEELGLKSCEVGVDLAIKDDKVLLIEVSSHVGSIMSPPSGGRLSFTREPPAGNQINSSSYSVR